MPAAPSARPVSARAISEGATVPRRISMRRKDAALEEGWPERTAALMKHVQVTAKVSARNATTPPPNDCEGATPRVTGDGGFVMGRSAIGPEPASEVAACKVARRAIEESRRQRGRGEQPEPREAAVAIESLAADDARQAVA